MLGSKFYLFLGGEEEAFGLFFQQILRLRTPKSIFQFGPHFDATMRKYIRFLVAINQGMTIRGMRLLPVNMSNSAYNVVTVWKCSLAKKNLFPD